MIKVRITANNIYMIARRFKLKTKQKKQKNIKNVDFLILPQFKLTVSHLIMTNEH